MEVQTANIGKLNKSKTEMPPFEFSDELIVIISPIHGFNYPHITLKFINRLPKGSNRVVLMNTRAGLKIGNWVTWGLSGAAFFCSSWVLRRKGYKIVGQIPFDMPSNWISTHPALTDKASKFIHEKNRQRVEKHAELIFSEKKDFLARRELAQDILIFPIALAYYFFGRFLFAKSFYATNACDNCGICERECPVQAIQNSEHLPFWTYKCESCMKCMNVCPKRAIETTHGLWVVLTVSSFILSALFAKLLSLSGWADTLLWNVIFFVLFFALYKIQYIFLKNKWVGGWIALTSLTHYKFWGRYYSNKKRR